MQKFCLAASATQHRMLCQCIHSAKSQLNEFLEAALKRDSIKAGESLGSSPIIKTAAEIITWEVASWINFKLEQILDRIAIPDAIQSVQSSTAGIDF